MAALVEQGLSEGRAVLLCLPDHALIPVRERLGPTTEFILCLPMSELGASPSRILPALAEFADEHRERPVLIISEPVWADRNPEEIREAVRHEALLNVVFTDRDVESVCCYHTALPETVLLEARRTHPTYRRDAHGEHQDSIEYTLPLMIVEECDSIPLSNPPNGESLRFQDTDLPALRRRVQCWAVANGLPEHRTLDLQLAVDEAASNSVRHGGGTGTLRYWRHDRTLLVQVEDKGRLTDPLAGRLRPSREGTGGRGLWLIHQVCDLVEQRNTPLGSTIRMWMRLPGPTM